MNEKKRKYDKLVISNKEIKDAIFVMSRDLMLRFKDEDELYIICVMSGAIQFCVDLMTKFNDSAYIHKKVHFSYIDINSYHIDKQSELCLEKADPRIDDIPQGKKILVVDTVLDSGKTLTYIHKLLTNDFKYHFNSNDIYYCFLIRKDLDNLPPLEKYWKEHILIGFTTDDRFLVGYGLDINGFYRDLNEIYEYDPNIFK